MPRRKKARGFGLSRNNSSNKKNINTSSIPGNNFLQKVSTNVSAAAAAFLLAPAASYALPEGLVIRKGEISVKNEGGNSLILNQTTKNAFGDWESFNINVDELVNINQPTVDSLMVGRIVGGNATEIFGGISANGSLLLLNPQGIIFGENASINAANFSASTLDIDFEAFDNDNAIRLNLSDTFTGEETIKNLGNITVEDTGLISIIAPHVINEGLLSAPLGKVQIASGSRATLDISGDGILGISLEESIEGLIKNKGIIVWQRFINF